MICRSTPNPAHPAEPRRTGKPGHIPRDPTHGVRPKHETPRFLKELRAEYTSPRVSEEFLCDFSELKERGSDGK
ncbi:hypothetical protein GOODEAATRI_017151 [Goodea atripinnis]|uniref:Uncharacterized protein n=1 Tax=Goodea atripinnis TaxID=208336 RepID=A0ABV0PYU7_9TELE